MRHPVHDWAIARPSTIDWEVVRSGAIPWSDVELGVAVAHMVELNCAKGRLSVWSQGGADGLGASDGENRDGLDASLSLFVLDRCRACEVGPTNTASHIWRLAEIRCFVFRNFAKLLGDGFATAPAHGPERLSGALLRTLATARYHGTAKHSPLWLPRPTFDYKSVAVTALLDVAQGVPPVLRRE